MTPPETLGIIAGNGLYPSTLASAARRAGVKRVVVAAFENETDPGLGEHADAIEWLRVGQLGRMVRFFRAERVAQAMMAGQIAPRNLFDLRPDIRALMLLGRVRLRNAESIFGAIADDLARDGITLLPATTFLDDLMVGPGVAFGPTPTRRQLADIEYGYSIAREMSRLDIGQTVVVKNGSVLAVEAFEGTDECLRRGGALGRGRAIMVKVSKPRQDFRFDVPVVGPKTVQTAADAGVSIVAVEAGRTLILDREEVRRLCEAHRVTVLAVVSAADA